MHRETEKSSSFGTPRNLEPNSRDIYRSSI
jgi:hypothetical protein